MCRVINDLYHVRIPMLFVIMDLLPQGETLGLDNGITVARPALIQFTPTTAASASAHVFVPTTTLDHIGRTSSLDNGTALTCPSIL